MIIVHINPAGVEKIYLESGSELAEDLCLAAWPLVRKEVNQLDKKLKKAAARTLEMIERAEKNGELCGKA
jgi:hypothetical protein